MRTFLAMLSGSIVGAALGIALYSALHDSRTGDANKALPHPQVAPAPDSGAVSRLQARIRELEEALARAGERRAPPEAEESSKKSDTGKKPAPPGELPAAEALAELVKQGDSAGLAKLLESLLLRGEEGYAVLLEFLNGQAQTQRYAFFRNDRMAFALLSVIARHGEKTAEFAHYLLSATEQDRNSILRGELFRLLPAFLAFHGDRFAGLEQELEASLLRDLEGNSTSSNLWKNFQSMKELGMEPPLEALESILGDSGRKHQHMLAIQELGNQDNPAGVAALARYIDGSENFKDYRVRRALQALARMETPESEVVLNQYIASPNRDVREEAILAHFSRPRDLSSYNLAVEFLNSDAGMTQKHRLISQLRGSGGEILETLKNSGGQGIADENVRSIIIRGATTRAFKVNAAGGVQGEGAVRISPGK